MTTSEEIKNRRIAAGVSIGVHVLLLLLFIFLLAWRSPDPPHPEYGIEINYGTSETGSGAVQPEVPPVEQLENEEPAPDEESEPQEDVVEDEEVVEEQVQEEVSQEVVTDHESPDVVEQQEKTIEPEPDPEPEIEEERSPATEPVRESSDQGNQGEEESQDNISQGDNTNEAGDKGDPEGTVDARALYGQKGGGGGYSLSLTGWRLDSEPNINDQSNESGRIVFEIKVDDSGYVIDRKMITRTVSPEVAKIYQEAIENLTFSPTADNTVPAPVSTGKITFIIKSK